MAKCKTWHDRIIFFCPGCKINHNVNNKWDFNDDFEKPTFSPSVLVNPDIEKYRCHFFVRNGRIQYLTDCYHELRGQTIDMVEIT